jgi:hypothetical protein
VVGTGVSISVLPMAPPEVPEGTDPVLQFDVRQRGYFRYLQWQRSSRVTVRRLILLIGAVLLLAGAIGLLVPVSISDSDGHSIGCGNAVAADSSSAQAANDKHIVADIPVVNQIVPHTDYVSQCQSAISSRRTWTIPLAVIGSIALAASFLVRGRRTVGTGTL